MEITYTRAGDYLLPDIKLSEPPAELAKPLGRYGLLRQRYLHEHQSVTYSLLLLSERLYPHLRDVYATAEEQKRNGVSEEVILTELVFE